MLSTPHPQTWLCSGEVDAAYFYISQKFPHIDVFQSYIVFTRGCGWDTQTQFVQVMNINDTPWITASNLFCGPNEVCIYDSLNTYQADRAKIILVDLSTSTPVWDLKACRTNPAVFQQLQIFSIGLYNCIIWWSQTRGVPVSRMKNEMNTVQSYEETKRLQYLHSSKYRQNLKEPHFRTGGGSLYLQDLTQPRGDGAMQHLQYLVPPQLRPVILMLRKCLFQNVFFVILKNVTLGKYSIHSHWRKERKYIWN